MSTGSTLRSSPVTGIILEAKPFGQGIYPDWKVWKVLRADGVVVLESERYMEVIGETG